VYICVCMYMCVYHWTIVPYACLSVTCDDSNCEFTPSWRLSVLYEDESPPYIYKYLYVCKAVGLSGRLIRPYFGISTNSCNSTPSTILLLAVSWYDISIGVRRLKYSRPEWVDSYYRVLFFNDMNCMHIHNIQDRSGWIPTTVFFSLMIWTACIFIIFKTGVGGFLLPCSFL